MIALLVAVYVIAYLMVGVVGLALFCRLSDEEPPDEPMAVGAVFFWPICAFSLLCYGIGALAVWASRKAMKGGVASERPDLSD